MSAGDIYQLIRRLKYELDSAENALGGVQEICIKNETTLGTYDDGYGDLTGCYRYLLSIAASLDYIGELRDDLKNLLEKYLPLPELD